MPAPAEFPPPRFGTPRNLARPSLGGKVAKVGAALGTPFMPWQRHVADVACEVDPQTGFFWYREVRLLVTRQAGKTTLLRAKGTHRCLSAPRVRFVYTAQTRIMALQRLENDFYDPIADSALGYFLARSGGDKHKPGLRRQAGSEHIRWLNGSQWRIDATTKKAGHGPALDEGHIDEAFAHADSRIELAMRPAMSTKPHAQLWIVSAAGDSESHYLRGKVEDGRARVQSGRPGRVAVFEWSAEDDADPDDPAVWAACIPSLGWRFPDGGGVTTETIAAERDAMDDDDFRRAYLGQWRDRARTDAVIPAWQWGKLLDPTSMIESSVQRFALDVSPMLTHASITAAGLRFDERPHVEVTGRGAAVDSRPGTSWVVPRCSVLARDIPGFVLGIAKGSPAETFHRDLLEAGVDVVIVPQPEIPLACGAFFRLAMNDGLRHLGQAELDTAVASAAKKDLGDGLFIWARRRSTGDITALYAATLASWLVTNGQLPPNIW